MNIEMPEVSLVLLIGASGSGKSTFAAQHFKATEIVSSDRARGIVSDDENAQYATGDAFDLVHFITRKRLKNGLLTVIDATNVQQESRKPFVEIAREYHCLPVAIVFDIPDKISEERNKFRTDRDFGSHVIRNQRIQLRRSLKNLKREGFRHIIILKSEEEVNSVEQIIRTPLFNNKNSEHGPFDIIGDVHGCGAELRMLLTKLGYTITESAEFRYGMEVGHPEGRRAVFVGDLVDRGPETPFVLKLVMSMTEQGTGFCVPGNHDAKLLKKLNGRDVQIKHGLAESLDQLSREPAEFIEAAKKFLYGLTSHYVFDDKKLVVAHAGLKEEMQGRASGAVRDFCLYGETTGETDEFGLPVRYNWAADYRGQAAVVYGHTPVPEPQWLNNTLCIDTGCVFGGALTALRYPEREIVSVPALQEYCEPVRPIVQGSSNDSTKREDNVLNYEDVSGKRVVETRLMGNVTIKADQASAALEVMSRFAIAPQWLIYLPPTMSPTETSPLPEYLEHPTQAFEYYRKNNVERVVCEEKHMGSRAVLVVCRSNEVARKRFRISDTKSGVCYTRTGRGFFTDDETERLLIERVRRALDRADFWNRFSTDWVCLDAELMPWSAKALALLKTQYAPVATAAEVSFNSAIGTLQRATERLPEANDLLEHYRQRHQAVMQYRTAYRQYCWDVVSLDDYKLAPFHLLATEGAVHTDKSHVWHMEELKKICAQDENILLATPFRVVTLNDTESEASAIQWWKEMTADGGEGMVVKPYDFVATNKQHLLQPAVKCRGAEYLRIIYGPEYTLATNMERLKQRGVSAKRSLALREFALGIESLERFVRHAPFYAVHEAVFGVLAMESEPIDPRL